MLSKVAEEPETGPVRDSWDKISVNSRLLSISGIGRLFAGRPSGATVIELKDSRCLVSVWPVDHT